MMQERGWGVMEMEREKWGGVYHVEDKEKQEVESQAPSMVIVEGRGGGVVDEKSRDKALAPALCRTQGSDITHVLAAGRSGCHALALPSNIFLPSPLPAAHQHPPACCSAHLTNKLQTF